MVKADILIFDTLPSRIPDIPDNGYIRAHIGAIKNERYKIQALIAYSLFAKMLHELTGKNISHVTIEKNEHGKPYIVGEDIYFNLSHSKNAIACVISDAEVGIDIECIGVIRDSIFRKCFAPSEAQKVHTPADFYRYWTLKEAYLKAVGTGIDRRLDTVAFELDDVIACTACGAAVPYHFYSDAVGEYALAICANEAVSKRDVTVEYR